MTLAALLVGAACGAGDGQAGADAEDDRLHVVSTFSVITDLIEAIAGEHAEIDTIVPVGADPHDYEASPSDSVALAEADVVLDNGLGLNEWLDPLTSDVEGELVIITEAMSEQAVTAVTEDEVDPHMWLSPALVIEGYIPAIEQALTEAAPEHAEDFAEGADEARAAIEELDAALAELAEQIPEDDRVLVTHEDAFGYFAEHFDFEILGTAVGPSTEADPSAAGVAGLIDLVGERDVPAVFPQTTESPDTMAQVARDAGVTFGDELHVDSVDEPGSGADDYPGMMRANLEILVEGLTGQAP